jgi:hypothetical protein
VCDGHGKRLQTYAWLSAEPHEALKLQRPLLVEQLKIVAAGKREDGAPE